MGYEVHAVIDHEHLQWTINDEDLDADDDGRLFNDEIVMAVMNGTLDDWKGANHVNLVFTRHGIGIAAIEFTRLSGVNPTKKEIQLND